MTQKELLKLVDLGASTYTHVAVSMMKVMIIVGLGSMWLTDPSLWRHLSKQTQAERLHQTEIYLEKATKLESTDEDESLSNQRSITLTPIPLLVSTFVIFQLANRVEHILGRFFPGSARALIARVAPLLNSLVQAKDVWNPFSRAATIWSDFFFFLSFFASIGVAANMSSRWTWKMSG